MNQSLEYIKKLAGKTIPAMRYDCIESYENWKKRAAEKLYELLGLPFFACEDLLVITAQEECENYKRIDFTYQSEEDYFVPGSLLVPHGVKLPGKTSICIQGHSSGMHISFGIEKFKGDDVLIAGGRNFAERAVQEGYCAVVLEQRYMGSSGQLKDGAPLCARRNAALPALLMGRTAIGERVWDVQRLLDIMERYFAEYVDMEQVLCMGNSGGGTTTFYAACVDERIKLAMPSCSVCEFDDSIISKHHCCCNYIPGIRKYFEMGDMAGLLADRKLVMVCGVLDPDFPIEGVEKSYQQALRVFDGLGRGNYCRLVKGPEGHQFYPDLAWPIANMLMEDYKD